MNKLQRFWPILFLAILTSLPLLRGFSGKTIGPHDQIQTMVDRTYTKPMEQAWDVLMADGVLQFYVWRDLVFESWSKGKLPAWNPYSLGGTPLLANSQSGALYPLHIVVGKMGIPTATAVVLLAWFHLLLASLGTYAAVRAHGGSKVGATIAAASFGLSPFMLGWTPLASVITTVAWIPWVWTFSVLLAKSSGNVWRNSGWLGLSVGMLLLGGHLQFAAYGLLACALVGITTLIASKTTAQQKAFAVGGVVAALVVGGLMAYPQIKPVLEFSKNSHRASARPNYDAYVASAIKPYELSNLVYPKALGDPREKALAEVPVSTYWPQFTKIGANWAESAISIGPIVLFGLILICVNWRIKEKRSEMLIPLAVGVIFLLLAMGTPLNKLLFTLPGWAGTGSPGRAACIWVLGCCIAAGVSIGSFIENPPSINVLKYWAVATVIVCMLPLALSGNPPAVLPGIDQEVFKVVYGAGTAGSFFPMMVMAVLAPQAAIFQVMRRFPNSGILWLASMVVCFGVWGAFSIIPMSKPLDLSAVKTSLNVQPSERIAVHNDNWQMSIPAHAYLPPNILALARIREIGGYDSLMDANTKKMLDDISGEDSAPPANGNMAFVKHEANPELLKEAGVSLLVEDHNHAIGGSRFFIENGTFSVEKDEPGVIVLNVTASQDTTLIVRERNIRGWHLNGKLLEPTSGLWLEVPVQKGNQRIELSYVPYGYSPMLGFVGIFLFFALMGASMLSRKKA